MSDLIPVYLDQKVIDKTTGFKATKCPKNLRVYTQPNNWLTRKLWKYLDIKLSFSRVTPSAHRIRNLLPIIRRK